MSYPSLNASSRALPPIAPGPSPRKKLFIPVFHRRSSHDLPMMDLVENQQQQQRSPSSSASVPQNLAQLGQLPPPTRPSAGQNFHSSPALGETLKGWRRSRTDSVQTSRDSVLRPPRPYRDQIPSAPASGSSSPLAKNKPIISSPHPTTSTSPHTPPTKPRRHSPPIVPRIPASFDAVLLSLKSVSLPCQPPRIDACSSSSSAGPSTLVQLHIAGQTFLIQLEKIQRSSSFLFDFVTACLAMEEEATSPTGGSWDGRESDGGTFSEVETDWEASRSQTSLNRYSSDR
jgi:hypothetical protein